jgi:hypothetical protein
MTFCGVGVPVNARAEAELRHPASQMEDQARRSCRIRFVVSEGRDDADLIPVEFFRRVAVLARVGGGTQVEHRRRHRPRIAVLHPVRELTESVQLVVDVRLRAGSDMTLDAVDTRVGTLAVSDILRLHHRMANLAAELRRVHVFDRAVRSQRDDQQVHDRQGEDDADHALVMRIAQVDARQPSRREPLRLPAAFEHAPQRDHQQAEHEQDG